MSGMLNHKLYNGAGMVGIGKEKKNRKSVCCKIFTGLLKILWNSGDSEVIFGQ